MVLPYESLPLLIITTIRSQCKGQSDSGEFDPLFLWLFIIIKGALLWLLAHSHGPSLRCTQSMLPSNEGLSVREVCACVCECAHADFTTWRGRVSVWICNPHWVEVYWRKPWRRSSWQAALCSTSELWSSGSSHVSLVVNRGSDGGLILHKSAKKTNIVSLIA